MEALSSLVTIVVLAAENLNTEVQRRHLLGERRCLRLLKSRSVWNYYTA